MEADVEAGEETPPGFKAQVAARAGLTGLSSDFSTKKRLNNQSQLRGKGAPANANLLSTCSVA